MVLIPYSVSASSRPLDDGRDWYRHAPDAPGAIMRSLGRVMGLRMAVNGGGGSWSGDGTRDVQRAEFGMVSKLNASIAVCVQFYVTPMLTEIDVADQHYIIIGQLHRTPDAGDATSSPPVELRLHPDGIRVGVHWHEADPSPGQREAFFGPWPFAIGAEHHVSLRIKVGPAGSGALMVCIDGIPRLDLKAVPLGFTDSVGPYWKFGVYTAPSLRAGQSIAAFYRDMTVSQI